MKEEMSHALQHPTDPSASKETGSKERAFDETEKDKTGSDDPEMDQNGAADIEGENETESELWKIMREINDSMRNMKVLSATDLQGKKRTINDGFMYNGIEGFVGKVDEIAVGKRMYLYYPKTSLTPDLPVKLHTGRVIFHSEELISENEIRHVVRTRNSIYTLIEFMKEHEVME